MTNHKFRTSEYDGYASSPEILQAIEQIAGCEFGQEDIETPAARLWSDPNLGEVGAVIDAAFALAEPGEDTLVWGQFTVRRPKS